MSSSDFDDFLTDAKLHIKTTGRVDDFSDYHMYPYEASSYSVLDRLAQSGWIRNTDHLLDYGCGKARTLVYLHDKTGCRATGVEVMQSLYDAGCENIALYDKNVCAPHGKHCNIDLVCTQAQIYDIPASVNRIFFFNPFSVEIFKSVMKRVIDAYYDNPGQILMFLYYPQDEYVAYLSRLDEVMFEDEIDCTDLFPEKDSRNRIMIYSVGEE